MGRKLESVGNEGNPNKVGDFNKSVKIGSALLLGAQSVRAAMSGDKLAPAKKALAALGGFAVAGGTTGPLVPAADPLAPATGEVGVDLSGDLIFASADAVTEAEVTYLPLEGDTISATGVVGSTGSVVLANGGLARIVLEATVDGLARTVVARGTAPSAGEVAVSTDGKSLAFNAADAGKAAVFSYVAFPAVTTADALASLVQY